MQLIGFVIGFVVTRYCTGCWVGLFICSVAVLALLGWDLHAQLLRAGFHMAALPLSASLRRVCWSKWDPCGYSEPVFLPCRGSTVLPRRSLQLCPFYIVCITDLLLGCGMESAVLGARVQWLQELRWLCAAWNLGCLCGRPLPGPVYLRYDFKIWFVICGTGGLRELNFCVLLLRGCPPKMSISLLSPGMYVKSTAAGSASAMGELTVGSKNQPEPHLRLSELSLEA